MKGHPILFGIVCWMLFVCNAPSTVFYVDVNSTNPVPPYAGWSTASTDIQSAIDAASDGDQIWVNDGIYQTGGRVVYGSLTNRVVINKAVTVQSVNGPAVTFIQGYQVPGTTNGSSAIRCVYLTNNAALLGLTLTNGATRDDGGLGSLINLNGGGIYCESASATVSNCVIIRNSARVWGGGVSSGTLNNCLLTSNIAMALGGGATGSTLNDCLIIGNQAAGGGGGINVSLLNRCQITGNQAANGGGALAGILNNCALIGNSANIYGGGAHGATLNNCTLTGNSAPDGGGASKSTLNNCIVYYNFASSEANYANAVAINRCTLNYSCSTPFPTNGVGNIAAEPLLADFLHISMDSPCRGAGSFVYVSGTDIDGEAWNNPPSIGCDEYLAGSITGALNVAITATATNVAAGYSLNFISQITGHASKNLWNFGDGLMATNQPYPTHSWIAAGDYNIILSVFNESNPGGISSTATVHVVNHPIHHVAIACTNPISPYLTWDTAATNIQDAVDALYPGAIILVSNGVYQTGGRVVYGSLTNRLAITKPVQVQSVNGPAFTLIQGYQVPGTIRGNAAVRCVYLTNGATLIGFTLTNGATRDVTTGGDITNELSGGGAWCLSTNATLINCVLIANSANNGGGAYSGTLNNCLITANTQWWSAAGGAGISGSTLNNCTLTGNHADNGGGAFQGVLNNCIVLNNTGLSGSNYLVAILNNCCTQPLPTSGIHDIMNVPLFVNSVGGDYHLQSNSPCINCWQQCLCFNARMTSTAIRASSAARWTSALMNIRRPSSVLSYAWAQQYGLPTDGTADYADSDGDGMNNWQEWIAGTNPTNAASVLALYSPATTNTTGITVTWQSVNTRDILFAEQHQSPGLHFHSKQHRRSGRLNQLHGHHRDQRRPVFLSRRRAVNMKLYSILFSAVCWMLFACNASATVFYVDVNNTNPVPPYAGWSTASTDIQSAIDAASDLRRARSRAETAGQFGDGEVDRRAAKGRLQQGIGGEYGGHPRGAWAPTTAATLWSPNTTVGPTPPR